MKNKLKIDEFYTHHIYVINPMKNKDSLFFVFLFLTSFKVPLSMALSGEGMRMG